MEYDSWKSSEIKGEDIDEAQHLCVDACDLLQPARFRRAIQSSNGLDRFLLDYGYNFLPYVAIIIYSIFLLG